MSLLRRHAEEGRSECFPSVHRCGDVTGAGRGVWSGLTPAWRSPGAVDVSVAVQVMASPAAPQTAPQPGILIGDRLYSEVSLTIDHSLIPEERLSPTPSMQDGLDLHSETDLRILGCELIQGAGILLRLPQVGASLGGRTPPLPHRHRVPRPFSRQRPQNGGRRATSA